MKLERFAPSAAYEQGKLYCIENCRGNLFFYAHLLGSGINICLDGQPSDYEFFHDKVNDTTIVHKIFDWVVSIRMGQREYSISSGMFSNTSANDDEILFTDIDQIVLGPKTPLPAARYDANSGTLVDATVVSSSLVSWSPARKHQLTECFIMP